MLLKLVNLQAMQPKMGVKGLSVLRALHQCYQHLKVQMKYNEFPPDLLGKL